MSRNFDINLGNIFNSVGTTYKNYSVVSVTPFGNIMAGSQCDYGDGTVDGEEYEFNGDTDYTGFFDVVEYEDFFTVDGLYSIETILIERHNGAEVEIPESVPEHAEFFIMTVKSTTQDSKITIYLKTAPILDEIVLPEEILF